MNYPFHGLVGMFPSHRIRPPAQSKISTRKRGQQAVVLLFFDNPKNPLPGGKNALVVMFLLSQDSLNRSDLESMVEHGERLRRQLQSMEDRFGDDDLAKGCVAWHVC